MVFVSLFTVAVTASFNGGIKSQELSVRLAIMEILKLIKEVNSKQSIAPWRCVCVCV